MSKKLIIEFVKSEFEKEDYILLTKKYINNKQQLNYFCPKGHNHSISWNDWSNKGARCWYCFGTPKKLIEDIKQEFDKEKYRLLTVEYINKNQKLEYVCDNNHEHRISWDCWNQGSRCPYCVGLARKTIEFIKSEFEKENCVLLSSTYKNARQKLDYICSSGHKHSIRWTDWKKGHRCFTCKYIEQLGSGNSSWKGGISCEPYCYEWSFKEFKEYIKERDGNRCLNPDCWGNIHKLCIHHIDYNKKNCEPENLITLCKSCNSRANKDREWYNAWYKAIIYRRYHSDG